MPLSLPSTSRPTVRTRLGWHHLRWLLRRYWWLTLVGLVGTSALTWVATAAALGGRVVFALAYTEINDILPLRIWVIVLGVLHGFVLFGHLWSRRESGMYLTLGVSRTKQFSARYLLGAGSLLASIILPLAVAYASGISRLGGDSAGVCGIYTVTFTVSLALVVLLTYAVTVTVAVLSGRFMSAALSLGGVLAAPYTLLYAVQGLIGKYLLGSPLGYRFNVYEHIPNLLGCSRGAGLFTMLEGQLEIVSIHQWLTDEGATDAWQDKMTMLRDAYALPTGNVLLLCGVLVVLSVVACLLFRRRPAEVAGQVYTHPVLTVCIALTVALGVGGWGLTRTLPVDGLGNLGLSGLIFAVSLVLVMLVVMLLLTKEWRATLRLTPAAGGAVAVVLGAILCLGGGWFGYADYVPATDEIASVTVRYNQNAYLMPNETYTRFREYHSPIDDGRGGIYLSVEDDIKCLYSRGLQADELCHPLTTAEDIARVRAIHETIIADGHHPYSGRATEAPGDAAVTARYLIVYTLKDGSTVERYYNTLRLSTLEATLQIEETEVYKTAMREAHAASAADEVALEIGDAFFLSGHLLDLTREEKATLYAALDADYAALSQELRYHPAPADIVGIIRERVGASGTVGKPTGDIVMWGFGDFADEAGAEVFYITTAHERTLAFLAERGLTAYFHEAAEAADYTIKSIKRQPYTTRHYEMGDGITHTITHLFLSYPGYDQLDYKHAETITEVPAVEWEALLARSVPTAYLSRPASLICITYETPEGETRVLTRVVPEDG